MLFPAMLYVANQILCENPQFDPDQLKASSGFPVNPYLWTMTKIAGICLYDLRSTETPKVRAEL